jgi:hypothetical protein
MLLTEPELAFVRSHGLYITEKCDGCGKLLNQTFRYTVADKPEVFCSPECRDLIFFGDHHEARKRSTPKLCAFCRAPLKARRRQTLFCDHNCQMRYTRQDRPATTAEARETVTAA